ncbi:FRIGIDA-like protein 4a [Nymphaea thermarum]|nr:FRIGIDA-like protein 4a [Nymphaea thermarum]
MAAVHADPFQKAIDHLEAERAILTNFTNFWKDLSSHISSLEQTLQQKSETLESKLQTLDSTTKEALESLATREESLPSKELAASERVERLKEAALAQIEEHSGALPKGADVARSLRFLCLKMDADGLWRFLIARRKELATIRAELEPAVADAVDPASLVLQALEDFVFRRADKVGLSDQRWACGMLLRALSADEGVATSVKERAMVLAETWKEKIHGNGEGGLASNAAEVQMFLQLLVTYKLVEKFEMDYLKKFVVAFASRRDMPKLAVSLGFNEKMGEIIEQLIGNGKEVDAVYFIYESGLTSQFPPVPLLKAYLKNAKKNANGGIKTGSTDDGNLSELNALKALIRCIEDHKLEAEFSPESLKKRVSQLEKAKLDKKKFTGPPKSQNKRSRASGGSVGSASFPPAKAGRHANAYPSSMWRDRNIPAHHYPAAPFPPSYSAYDYPYLTETSSVGSRSPAAMSQSHYSYVPEDVATTRAAAAAAAVAAAAAAAAATPSYTSATANYSGYGYGSGLSPYQGSTYPH